MLTCLLYLGLALTVTLLTNFIQVKKMGKVYYLFPILLYAVFVGTRYDTGTDWLNYKEIYEYILNNKTFSVEFVYFGINYSLKYIGVHYIYIFSLFAFLQIFLTYTGFYQNKIQSALSVGILLYFMGGPFISSMNIMRQALVFCIFFNLIPIIEERRFYLYLVIILLMTGIHTASIILLPFYLLGNRKVSISYRKITVLIFIITMLVGETIFVFLGDAFFSLIKLDQFARYSQNFLENKFEYGLGIWIMKFIDLGIIWFSENLKSLKNKNIVIIYWLFVIGTIINNMAVGNQLVIRLAYCFISFRYVLLAVMIHVMFRGNKSSYSLSKCFAYGSMGLMISVFVVSVIKNSNGVNPYNSFFQFWV